MPVSRLDVAYRKILLSKLFIKGWGDPNNLIQLFSFKKQICNRDSCYKLVPDNYPIEIINQERRTDCTVIDGKFVTPLERYLSNIIPEKVKEAYFQIILPLNWSDEYKPICIHLAGTGDHYFWRRRNLMVKPLLKYGIAAVILENPYYGLRKPHDQIRSCLHYVSDIFVMGGCLILECIALLNWCEKNGFGPLGLTGVSMGGHMASLAATNWPKPVPLIPCLSWSTASSVFTEGVMSESVDWDMLQEQYTANELYCEFLAKLCKILDDPLESNLGSLHEFHFDLIWEDLGDSNRRTPFEILSLINSCNQQKIISQEKKLFSLKQYPLTKELLSRVSKYEKKKRDKEALWFMRGLMDECTHLKNFSIPYDTSLVIAVCASLDGYIPRRGITNLEELWPGVIVKYVKGGHIGACLWHRKIFRKCIIEAFEKAKQKLPPPRPDLYVFN